MKEIPENDFQVICTCDLDAADRSCLKCAFVTFTNNSLLIMLAIIRYDWYVLLSI